MKEAELEKEGEVMEEDQRGSSMDKGSSVSDEKEKGGVKSPGRIKCTACVSLCCTKQSQAKHLSLSLKNKRVEEEQKSDGKKEREDCGSLKNKKSSPTQVRAEQKNPKHFLSAETQLHITHVKTQRPSQHQQQLHIYLLLI